MLIVSFFFEKAINENPLYALRCLFYLRDVRGGGQGERRFFRVCLRWLADNHSEFVCNNLNLIAEYGRWDDYYVLVGTKLEHIMFDFLRSQYEIDLNCKTPSLLGKWLKSENASNADTIRLARLTARAFGKTPRQYRISLSTLRQRINVLERLMSANQWDKIEFDKIPSKAGMIYRNAFARRDIIKEKYRRFALDKNTKVNAKTLYPYEVVKGVLNNQYRIIDETERAMLNKYWDNLTDYFNGAKFNGFVLADVSGSMYSGCGNIRPIDISISLALYCADKCSGPYKDYFMTFSRAPQLVKVQGFDFCDKVQNIYNADWGYNTDLGAALDRLLKVACLSKCKQEDIPENLIIVSDMEIDTACGSNYQYTLHYFREQWKKCGYKMPKLVFWNVNARNDTILDKDPDVTCISGGSPVLFEQILNGKTGLDLMYDKLNSERYAAIKL